METTPLTKKSGVDDTANGKLQVTAKLFALTFILVGHLTLLYFSKFTLWPEMVVYPYLINVGFSLYTDIIMPYPPFFPGFLAAFSNLFGYNPLPYQIFTWLVIVAVDISILVISKKIFGQKSAILSVGFFALLSVQFGINGLWFDLVQTPFILFSLYYLFLFTKKTESFGELFLSSLFLAVAFFIKQQVLWLGAFFLLALTWKYRGNFKKLLSSYALASTPFLIILIFEIIFFAVRNQLDDYLTWSIIFPLFKASTLPGYVDFPSIRSLPAIVSLILLFTPTIRRNDSTTNFFIISFLSLVPFAYPRFDYFHLIPALAVLSIIFGQNLINLRESKIVPIFPSIGFFVILLFSFRFFQNNWVKDVRFFETEIYDAAKVIALSTSPNEPIYIQNGPDQLFVLAKRIPSQPWADEFPWYLEFSDTQEKIVQGLNKSQPSSVIYKPYSQGPAYHIGSYKPGQIVDYISNNYSETVNISNNLILKTRIVK